MRNYQNARQKLLNIRVPERICPECGYAKPRSNQWVILRHVQAKFSPATRRAGAVCRSCYWRAM